MSYNVSARPCFSPTAPSPDTSAEIKSSALPSQRDEARKTIHVLTTEFDDKRKRIAYPFHYDIQKLLSGKENNFNKGRWDIAVFARERDAVEITDREVSDVLEAIPLTRDSFVDLRSSQVRFKTPESAAALVRFVERCPMDTVLYLPSLPTDKLVCAALAKAMQQRDGYAQLRLVFSQGHTGGEFTLAKWTHKDLLAWANQPS